MSDFDWNGNDRRDIGDDYTAYSIISDDDDSSGGSGGGGRPPKGGSDGGCAVYILTGLILWRILRLIF